MRKDSAFSYDQSKLAPNFPAKHQSLTGTLLERNRLTPLHIKNLTARLCMQVT